MTAGTGLLDRRHRDADNFLEIERRPAQRHAPGVLNAWDSLAASTEGIYLTETSGDLKLDIVWTRGDVSLVTLAGSIVDARDSSGAGDAEANVFGTNVDLDANGRAPASARPTARTTSRSSRPTTSRPSPAASRSTGRRSRGRAVASWPTTSSPARQILVSGAGTPYNGTYTIVSVTATMLTLTTQIAPSSVLKSGVTIAAVPGDVGLEADGSIYLTEMRGTLHARARRGVRRRHPDHRPRDDDVPARRRSPPRRRSRGTIDLRRQRRSRARPATSPPTASRPNTTLRITRRHAVRRRLHDLQRHGASSRSRRPSRRRSALPATRARA